MKRSAVFLDRDGVLNVALVRDGKPYPPKDLTELRFEPGVGAACAQLKAHGHLLVAVTNQPDIARGSANIDLVSSINEAVAHVAGLDDVRVCPHDDSDDCVCRKPKPGLILEAAADYGIDLAQSVIVGDRWRDIEAGQKAGVATVFLDRGYSERQPSAPDHVAASLAAATPWIIKRLKAGTKGTPCL